MNALNKMIGGAHYNVGGLDPNTYAMANGWDPCAYNILRYLSRHRAKEGLKDVEKAEHYVDIRIALLTRFPCSFMSAVPQFRISEFISANERFLTAIDCAALLSLDMWVTTRSTEMGQALLRRIGDIKDTYTLV